MTSSQEKQTLTVLFIVAIIKHNTLVVCIQLIVKEFIDEEIELKRS